MTENVPPPPTPTATTTAPTTSMSSLRLSALPPDIAQKLIAEALGTFVLVFFGVGSVVILSAAVRNQPGITFIDLTAIGLSFGIAVMVMVYAVGRISGGHFNPAVSLGAAIGGRVAWAEALAYMVVQVVSAIIAAGVLALVAEGYPGFSPSGRMGANSYGANHSGISWWAAFILEAVLTAVFVFVILAVTDIRNEHPALAPLAIGFTLAAIHFVAIPATGTSVNPARSIGPALYGGTDALKQLWLFIVAPLLGGAFSGILYPAAFGHGTEPVAGSGFRFRGRLAVAVPGYGAPDQLQQQWQQPWASGQAPTTEPYPTQSTPPVTQSPGAVPPGGPEPGVVPPDPAPTELAPPDEPGPPEARPQVPPD
jgi:aquaporin Z